MTRSKLYVFLFITLSVLSQAQGVRAARTYDYYLTGNGNNATKTTQPGYVLMGGGSDVAPAFRWMIDRSGGGDFVVLRASGDNGYNPYIWALGTVDSVETFVIKKAEAASDPFVVEKVRNAEAVFIAGGDQWDYMRLWQGTPLQQAMQEVAQRAPLGGTSAGLAVLGQWVYSAQRGSVTSDQALANPYHRFVTLAPGLFQIPVLQTVITDSHFTQRDRMGRLVTFMSRIVEDAWSTQATGIGVDEATAVALLPNGNAEVMGVGRAFVLRTTTAPERCDPGVPLTIRNVTGIRAPSGSTFSLSTLTGTGVTAITAQAVNGVLSIN